MYPGRAYSSTFSTSFAHSPPLPPTAPVLGRHKAVASTQCPRPLGSSGDLSLSFQGVWQHTASCSSRAVSQALSIPLFSRSPPLCLAFRASPCPKSDLLKPKLRQLHGHPYICPCNKLLPSLAHAELMHTNIGPLSHSHHPIHYSICPFSELKIISSQAFTPHQTLEMFRLSAMLPQLSL